MTWRHLNEVAYTTSLISKDPTPRQRCRWRCSPIPHFNHSVNPLRAASFTTTAQSKLQRVADWPRLPPSITLDRVIGVGVDSRGFVYVAHRGEHPLLCLYPDGRLCREVGADVQQKSIAYDVRGPVPIPMETRYWLHGLYVDPWDNVWVTDVSRHLVMKFGPERNLLLTLGVDGERGCDDRHFNQPTHVCVLPSGDFFVTDGYGNSRIVKFNVLGERILEWGTRGTAPGQFHTPHAITLGDDGFLYVSDRENFRIQVFDKAGRIQGFWEGLHGVDGLYAALDGFLYGSAGVDHGVVRLDRSGCIHDVWVDKGRFTYPHGIAIDPDGAIYLADSGDDWIMHRGMPDAPDRTYRLVPRNGGEGSRVVKLRIAADEPIHQ